MTEHRTPVRETAVIFNLSSHTLLLNWKKQMDTQSIGAFESKKKGRRSMKQENQKATKKQAPAEGSVEALQIEIVEGRYLNV